MELPRPDKTPSISTEQDENPFRNTHSIRNSAAAMPSPRLCRRKNLWVRLLAAAAFFAAWEAFSIVAATLCPERTDLAYCF